MARDNIGQSLTLHLLVRLLLLLLWELKLLFVRLLPGLHVHHRLTALNSSQFLLLLGEIIDL